MFFVLSKILSFLMMPISWIFLAFLVSFFWKRQSKKLRITGIIMLFIFTSPLLMDGINNYWEPPILLTEDIPESKVGVVLGGFSSYDTTSNRIAFRFGSDRFNQGIWLLQTKKIDRLVISGGSGFLLKPELRESVYVSKYADEIGIPMWKVLIESESRNTRENAIETKKLLEAEELSKEPILLITSGYHMPRAIACFEKQGLKVVPYCAESYRNESGVDLSSFIPNPLILAHWNVLMHEWLGYASYWAIGYV
jgi:uncharacterized SAM-binding protein YcdF (DUF218 family)